MSNRTGGAEGFVLAFVFCVGVWVGIGIVGLSCWC